jgi:type VI secretion system protein ImpI/type VI secretion system protein
MTLTLSILRCPDSAVPETRQVSGGDYRIGRGPDNDWVLPDPTRVLSKHHCVIEFRGGFWQVRDLSTNGTFLNAAAEPIGKDQVRPLSDGDRLRLGPFEIEARIAPEVAQGAFVPPPAQPYVPPPMPGYGLGGSAAPPAGGYPGAGSSGWVPPPDPLRDPMAPPPPGADIFSAPLPGLGPATPPPGSPGAPGPILPADFDPLAEPLPMPDHAPATSDAFLVPKPAAAPDILPEDWNLTPARAPDPFAGLPDPFAEPRRRPRPVPRGERIHSRRFPIPSPRRRRPRLRLCPRRPVPTGWRPCRPRPRGRPLRGRARAMPARRWRRSSPAPASACPPAPILLPPSTPPEAPSARRSPACARC